MIIQVKAIVFQGCQVLGLSGVGDSGFRAKGFNMLSPKPSSLLGESLDLVEAYNRGIGVIGDSK